MGEVSSGKQSVSEHERQVRICSKCNERPAGLNHTWCTECKRSMGVKYDEAREKGIDQKGFVRGCNAMKMKLLTDLTRFNPGGMMRVLEVSSWIAKSELPPAEEPPKVIKLREPAVGDQPAADPDLSSDAPKS